MRPTTQDVLSLPVVLRMEPTVPKTPGDDRFSVANFDGGDTIMSRKTVLATIKVGLNYGVAPQRVRGDAG